MSYGYEQQLDKLRKAEARACYSDFRPPTVLHTMSPQAHVYCADRAIAERVRATAPPPHPGDGLVPPVWISFWVVAGTFGYVLGRVPGRANTQWVIGGIVAAPAMLALALIGKARSRASALYQLGHVTTAYSLGLFSSIGAVYGITAASTAPGFLRLSDASLWLALAGWALAGAIAFHTRGASLTPWHYFVFAIPAAFGVALIGGVLLVLWLLVLIVGIVLPVLPAAIVRLGQMFLQAELTADANKRRSTGASDDARRRLSLLDNLRRSGDLTELEYQAKRQALIDRL